jgi:HEAT repeat protein
VPALIKTLHDEPNVAVRVGAADALGCIARQPDLAIPALIEALADPTGSVSFYAANSLGKFRSRATNAIPALLLDFESPELNYNKRNSAAVALSKISPDFCAKKVIPVLIREVRESRGVLQVPGSQSANMSLIALGQMQDEDDLVIPVLIEVADDSNYHQIDRGNALRCLGGFGPFAQSAVPKLSGLTNDPDVEVRAEALRALQKIDPAPMPIR